MRLDVVPLLELFAGIYRKPRDMQRFREDYLGNLTTADRSDVAIVPLGPMNPMAKEPVLHAIEALIALEAERILRDEIETLMPTLVRAGRNAKPLQIGDRRSVPPPAALKAGYSVLDAAGGWTNRITNDFMMRAAVSASAERGWCCITLWAQNSYSHQQLRSAIRRDVHRLAYVLQHGHPHTLRDWLAQEGAAQAGAGEQNVTEREELAYTAEVLAPLLANTDQPTLIAALYGDDAARQCGYPPLGLSMNAGFDLALAQFAGGVSRNL